MIKRMMPTIVNEVLLFFVSLLIFLSIGTYPLNVLGAISFYFLIKCFQHYFYETDKRYSIFLPEISIRLPIYFLGLLTSLIIIFLPSYEISISSEHIWNTFASLPLPAIARVISGYFILSVFPGYVLYDLFLRGNNFTNIQKICLIPALSYIASILIGLTLHTLGIHITHLTFTMSLWLIIMLMIGIRFLRREGNIAHGKKGMRFSLGFESFSLALIGVIWMLLAYATVFNAHLFSGYLNWDVPNYFVWANEFINFGPTVRAPYVWLNVFIWISQILTGLPMLYAFAGLQFYQFLLPLTFYMLLNTLFEKSRLAISGAFLLFFASSNNALALLWIRLSSPDIFASYLSGDYYTRWRTLAEYYYGKLGTSLALPVILSPAAIELIMTFLALTFAFKYSTEQDSVRKNASLFLTSLFWTTSLYTHNIFLALPTMLTVMLYLLILNKPKMVIAKAFGSFLLFGAMFEFLSRLYQFNYNFLPAFLSSDRNILNLLTHREIFIPILALLGYALLVILREHFSLGKYGERSYKAIETINSRSVMISFWLLGLFIMVLAFYFFVTNFAELSMSRPTWYNIILTRFAVTLPLATGGIPFLFVKFKKSSINFVLCWFTSFLLSILISFSSAELSGFVVWYIYQLTLPVACLAAVGVEDLITYLRSLEPSHITVFHCATKELRRYLSTILGSLRQIISILLIFSIGISFLSLAYTHEFTWVDGPRLVKVPEIEVYEWMNNKLPKGKVVFPLSWRSLFTLTSMVSNVRVLPLAKQYSPTWFSHSWLWDVLINSTSPEAILYVLDNLNVSYIYATEDDLAAIQGQGAFTLLSLIKAFPVEFGNSYAKLYSVPSYPVSNDSNYVVVESLFDSLQMNNIDVFNLLLRLRNKFAVVPDIELNSLKKGYVYFFPFNQHIPKILIENLINQVYNGSNVIFFDSSFASFNELNETLPIFTQDYLSLSFKNVNSTCPSKIVFNGQYEVNIEDAMLNLPQAYVQDSDLNMLAYYSLKDGTTLPYILYKRFGNGTITFINLFHPSSALLDSEIYSKILSGTANILLSYLPKQVPTNSHALLPIPLDLFKYVIPLPASLFYLKGLNGFFVYNDELGINGDFVVNSSSFYISADSITTKELVISGGEGSVTFQNASLKKVLIRGSGTLLAKSSGATISGTPVGSYAHVVLPYNINGTLFLKNVEGEIEIQQGQHLKHMHVSGENLTILLADREYTMLVKQPTIAIEGSRARALNGSGVGVLSYGSQFFSTAAPEKVSIEGYYTFRILYYSGQILVQILDISRMVRIPSD
jgi:hypothetical protein